MALQKDFTIGSLQVPNAYIRVFHVEYFPNELVTIDVKTFANKNDSDDKLQPICNCRRFNVSSSDENFNNYFSIAKISEIDSNIIKQSYNYLKTLPEFENSTDV